MSSARCCLTSTSILWRWVPGEAEGLRARPPASPPSSANFYLAVTYCVLSTYIIQPVKFEGTSFKEAIIETYNISLFWIFFQIFQVTRWQDSTYIVYGDKALTYERKKYKETGRLPPKHMSRRLRNNGSHTILKSKTKTFLQHVVRKGPGEGRPRWLSCRHNTRARETGADLVPLMFNLFEDEERRGGKEGRKGEEKRMVIENNFIIASAAHHL